MKNKDFGKIMEERTLIFSASVLRISATLTLLPEQKSIRSQLSRSVTSIGANYREANRSRSKADFRHKIKICESETNETIYWLELLKMLKLTNRESLQSLLLEANELLAIFTSIGNKVRGNELGTSGTTSTSSTSSTSST